MPRLFITRVLGFTSLCAVPTFILLPLCCRGSANKQRRRDRSHHFPCPLTPSTSRRREVLLSPGTPGGAAVLIHRQRGQRMSTWTELHSLPMLGREKHHTSSNRSSALPGRLPGSTDPQEASSPRAKKPLPLLQSHPPGHSQQCPLPQKAQGRGEEACPLRHTRHNPAGRSH